MAASSSHLSCQMWPRQFNFIAKRSSFFFFNIVPAHCWSIWWRSRLQFSVVDLMIQTLWSFCPPLSFKLLLIICSLSFFNWDNNSRSITMGDIFLFPFLFRDIKAFTKALLKYDQNTYFQFRHLRSLSLSYKHNKRYFAFSLINAPFFVQGYRKMNEVLNEDTSPKN